MLRLTSRNLHSVAKRAREVLASGGTVVYPTDTVYGLGANATMKQSVRRVYELKRRPSEMPLSVAVPDISTLKMYAMPQTRYLNMIGEILPGPYTLILPCRLRLPVCHEGKIGIRMPSHPLVPLLCKDFPVTCTSANISGRPSPRTVSEVEIEADLVIDGGPSRARAASTIIDLSSDVPRVLREGAGDTARINRILRNQRPAPP